MSRRRTEPVVNLVVAIPCEARPLLARFKLQPVLRRPFPLYEGEGLRLVLCGVGKTGAAAATAWLAGRQEDGPSDAWLNVGTAGHAARPLGQGLLAARVSDAASGGRWYPGLAFATALPAEHLLTVERPQLEYERPVAYEMEAAGFCAAAGRFAPWELIQCCKVISDNRLSPVHQVDEALVESLMTENLAGLADTVASLRALAAELAAIEADPPLLDWMLERWRLSRSRTARLRRLLQRHQALGGDAAALRDRLRYCTTPQAALARLAAEVEALGDGPQAP